MNKKVASTTEVHSHSKNEITIKLGDIELGDIVSLAAHPYPAITQAKDHNGTDDSPEGVKNKNPFPVKISAYNHFRSEEHTSELQSRGHIVCRLLREKKKIQT